MEYVSSLDAIPDKVIDYMQRALVVFPREDILNGKQETPVILINRSHCQSYFILDLHDRYHCDVGVNGIKMLLQFLHDKAVDYVMVKNNEKNTYHNP